MSDLATWFYQRQKEDIDAALRASRARIATAGTISGNFVQVADPYTGAIADELTPVVGPLPTAGETVVLWPTEDGTLIAARLGPVGSSSTFAKVRIESADDLGFELYDAQGDLAVRLNANNASQDKWYSFIGGRTTWWAGPGFTTEQAYIDEGVISAQRLLRKGWPSDTALGPQHGRLVGPDSAVGASSSGTMTLAANTGYVVPVIIPQDGSITELGFEVTTPGVAGTTVRLAINSSDFTTLMPSTLVYTSAAIDGGTLGIKSVGFTLTATRGRVQYLQIASSAAVTIRYLSPVRSWFGAASFGEVVRYAYATYPLAAGFTGLNSLQGVTLTYPTDQRVPALHLRVVS